MDAINDVLDIVVIFDILTSHNSQESWSFSHVAVGILLDQI